MVKFMTKTLSCLSTCKQLQSDQRGETFSGWGARCFTDALLTLVYFVFFNILHPHLNDLIGVQVIKRLQPRNEKVEEELTSHFCLSYHY